MGAPRGSRRPVGRPGARGGHSLPRVSLARALSKLGVCSAPNKPRGLVPTRDAPGGGETVYACLRGAEVPPHLAPVGRLDKASEGLLLFTNDTRWAARLLDPARHVDRIY